MKPFIILLMLYSFGVLCVFAVAGLKYFGNSDIFSIVTSFCLVAVAMGLSVYLGVLIGDGKK